MEELQNKVKKFVEKYDLQTSPEIHFIDLVSEIGEVGKELLKMTNYGRNPVNFREEIKEELGDALYSLITVANKFNIDLEAQVIKVLEKYEKRIIKGSPGSENK